MAFTRVATIAPVHAASGTPTISLTSIAASLQAGDVIVAGASVRGTTNPTGAPNVVHNSGANSPMTLVANSASAGNTTINTTASSTGYNFAFYQLTAADIALGFGTSGAVTWGTSTASGYSACLSVYRPTLATNVVTQDGFNHRRLSTASTTVTTTSGITTTVANTLLVAFAFGALACTWSAFDAVTDPTTGSSATTDTTNPPDSTWRERADGSSTLGADMSIAMADVLKATAGATGNLSVLASASALHAIGIVALKEAAPFFGPTLHAFSSVQSSTDTPSWPGGYTATLNDIAFLQVLQDGVTAFTGPAGWTAAYAAVGDAVRHGLYWKRLAGGDAAPTFTSTDDVSCVISIVRGAITSGTPYEDFTTQIGTTSGMTGAAIDTTGDNRLALRFWMDRTETTASPPAGWTEVFDSDAFFLHALDKREVPSASAIASGQRIGAGASDWFTATLAMLPTGGAAPTSLPPIPPPPMQHMLMR